MGTVKELNDRVRELEALVTAAQSETAAAKEDSLGAHGKVRALEEALLAASRQGEKAAAQLGDALAQEAASASERAEASRQASEQLNSVIIQRDKLEAKCTVQARELLSADAQLKELRQALKGSGMLDKAQADDLMQQLREAQREAEELRVAHSSSAEDGMAHVRQELGALMDGLADAKRVQQTFIQEEGEARQLLERHVRRGLADLQAKLSTVHREVDSAVGSPASSPSSPQRSPSLHLNLSSLKPPDHGLEERVRDLEARNRQLEQQARMLISSREMDILEKDRIVREAEQVRAESESRLWSTLQDQEEELHRRAQGSGERRDAEGQKYRRLRGRIEELEEQLRGKIRQLESDKVAPDGLRRQMEELMGAQRSVQSALEKLVVSQTALQEQRAAADLATGPGAARGSALAGGPQGCHVKPALAPGSLPSHVFGRGSAPHHAPRQLPSPAALRLAPVPGILGGAVPAAIWQPPLLRGSASERAERARSPRAWRALGRRPRAGLQRPRRDALTRCRCHVRAVPAGC